MIALVIRIRFIDSTLKNSNFRKILSENWNKISNFHFPTLKTPIQAQKYQQWTFKDAESPFQTSYRTSWVRTRDIDGLVDGWWCAGCRWPDDECEHKMLMAGMNIEHEVSLWACTGIDGECTCGGRGDRQARYQGTNDTVSRAPPNPPNLARVLCTINESL